MGYAGAIDSLTLLYHKVKAYVASKCPFEHSLRVTTYGRDNALRIKCQDDTSVSRSRPSVHQAPTVGILGQANAATQREANMVVAMARIACVHGPYLGQKATSGNFAMPTAPQEIEMGLVSEFNIYHLMTIDDPLSPFSCEVHLSEGSGQCKAVEKTLGPGTAAAPKRTNATPNSTRTDFKLFSFAPNQLGHLASIIRTKNAGPFEITFDAIFDSPAVYERVKASGVLAKSKVAEVLGIPESNVLVAMWWEQALAFKATIVRPMVSGGFGEIDMHGSCQHVPLMELEIPVRAGEVVAKQISSLSAGTRQLMAWCRDRRLGQVSMLLVAFSVASLMRLGKSSAVIEWLRWNTKK